MKEPKMISDLLDDMRAKRKEKAKFALKIYTLESQANTLDVALRVALKHLNDECSRDSRAYLAYDTRTEIESILRSHK